MSKKKENEIRVLKLLPLLPQVFINGNMYPPCYFYIVLPLHVTHLPLHVTHLPLHVTHLPLHVTQPILFTLPKPDNHQLTQTLTKNSIE